MPVRMVRVQSLNDIPIKNGQLLSQGTFNFKYNHRIKNGGSLTSAPFVAQNMLDVLALVIQ